MTEGTQRKQDGFVRGKSYDFSPAVVTNCIPVSGGKWVQKPFSHGWCLTGEEDGRYAFQGKPDGEDTEYYFHIEWGKGSVAEAAPPKHLEL